MSSPAHQIEMPPAPALGTPPPSDPRLMKRVARTLKVAGAAILVFVAFRLWGRYAAERHLATVAQGDLADQVVVVKPKLSAAVEQLVLPANLQAFIEAPIYARTDGYLKQWFFDIGAHVRAGDLLAVIETPEGDLQLTQARADLKQVQANAELAQRTADRWEALLKKNAVSRQETDQALSDLRAKQAAVDASAANVRRLEQLQDFEKVYAPFAGIVTARDTDIGALISGASSPRPLFRVASVDKLRVFTAVPEAAAAAVKTGAAVTLTLDQFPTRVFHGTITRDAGSIDPATRTLNVEVDIDNKSGELLPGSYGFVHLAIPASQAPLILPSNTLIFRSQGLQAAVVRDGRAVLVPIKIGHDYGETVEITAGVTAGDQVILDPPDSITDGTPVEVAAAK